MEYAHWIETVPAPFAQSAERMGTAVARAVWGDKPDSKLDDYADDWFEAFSHARAWSTLLAARTLGHWAGINAYAEARSVVTLYSLTVDDSESGYQQFASMALDDAIRAFIESYPEVTLDPKALLNLYGGDAGRALADEAFGNVVQLARDVMLSGLRDPDTAPSLTTFRGFMQTVEPRVRGYWETVYRTNVAQAYADGIVSQSMDVDGVVGFKRLATRDSTTRRNHAAGHGQVVSKYDANLDWFIGPWGFRCRCSTAPVTRREARQRGMEFDSEGKLITPPWPSEAHPDEGFRQ